MGWFDEQIRQRKRRDEELFKDSYDNISRKVLGEKVENGRDRLNLKSAIDEIFYYYSYPKVEIPLSIKDPLEQIEYAVNSVGMMKANITLGTKWYTDCFGPIICFFKDNDAPIALFPMSFARYYYYDPVSGKKVVVTKKNQAMFKDEAIAFYEPLPLKKLGVADLILFMKKRLSGYDYARYIAVSLLIVATTMVITRASKALTGEIIESRDMALFAAMVSVVVIALLFNALFGALKEAVLSGVKFKVTIPVEQAVMQRILTLPVPFFRQYSAGDLSSRSSSVSTICEIIVQDLFSLGVSAIVSLAYLLQITNLTPKLGFPSLVIVLTTVFFSLISTVAQMSITKKQMELKATENGMTYGIINGIQKIKLAGAEKRIFSKWANQYAESAALSYNPPFFLKINSAINTGISLIGTIVLYGIAMHSGVTTSEYYAFSISYAALFAAFSELTQSSMAIAKIKPVLDMAEPILKSEPEKTNKKEVVTRIRGTIELGGVYFRYSESTPYILEDFSLKIKTGEYIALVGKTGCGKSTLIRLILGFENPEKGVVLFDGKDISRLDLKSLRRKIGSVIQDGRLFYGDIFQNIAIASEKLTMDEAWEAAEMAGIADDIRAMPMGMHTIISEGQGGISGGQRQRILIARAVASKPKVLIFDEATSALDNITQKQISDALDSLKCTRIVIAHRLSTIRNCDRILVMDSGKIVEQGTYNELMSMNGYFADLVERQQL